MNFMQPPGQVDPRDLTSGQLAALRLVKEYRLSRVKNGWRAPGSPLVTLATMQILGAKRLVIRRDVHGKARIEVTGTGLNTLSVAEGRSRKSA
ncbi:MAG: hypothetical protein E5V91_22775 [Mesorhizobium sp.]|nr:MAG: hypothetical protein E5V91_22775 [Mesorhizobium sp.]